MNLPTPDIYFSTEEATKVHAQIKELHWLTFPRVGLGIL